MSLYKINISVYSNFCDGMNIIYDKQYIISIYIKENNCVVCTVQ